MGEGGFMLRGLTVLLVFVLLAMLAKPGYAYLDPGFASYVLQIIAAGVLSIVLCIKRIKLYILNLFNRKGMTE